MAQLNLNDPQIRETITNILHNYRQNKPRMIDDLLAALERVAERQKKAAKKQRKASNDAT